MFPVTSPLPPCPICCGNNFTPFFELPETPTQDGMLWKSQAEALAAPTGTIKLAFCHDCGYIGNLAFEAQKIRYDQEYSFSLYFSPTFREFVNGVATRLIDRFDLRHKKVLEIGCGEGDFLRLLCTLGPNDGVGVDPSIHGRVERVGGDTDHIMTFVQDWYSEQYADPALALIGCRQALDQLPNPKAMIELVRRCIGANGTTALYVEVPNAASIFEELLIRNIMYEKSSWFTLPALRRLFELAGFQVVAAEPCFEGGQYLGLEALPAGAIPAPHAAHAAEVARFSQVVQRFAQNHQTKVQAWAERLSLIRQQGERAIAWGSGAGGISFFSTLKIGAEIPYVVDINPRRQGRFLPLTGQEVVPPEFLPSYQPDTVIITNETYAQEIRAQVAGMEISCNYWVI